MDNPFYVPGLPSDLATAEAVAGILSGIVVKTKWDDHGGNVPVPPNKKYSVLVADAKPQYVEALQFWLNEGNPTRLRINLNEVGIATLGPPPLPCLVSYQCNYDRDPLATDPGPVPTWAKIREAALKAYLKLKRVAIDGKK